jgi:hypothetical protein
VIVKFDGRQFAKDMKNMMNYSSGFLEGIQLGKQQLLHSIGVQTVEVLKSYIDSNARINPSILHHVYEWNQTGSPDSRLYDIDYTISGMGLSFRSSFKQSDSIQDGSRVPFYDKAKIMENGIPVTIAPKEAQALRFEANGDEVFTRSPVRVNNPGGNTQGKYEKTFDSFFSKYFTQAFLRTSGIGAYLENPVVYKKNLAAGKKTGRSKGVSTGYRWVANAGVAKIGQ